MIVLPTRILLATDGSEEADRAARTENPLQAIVPEGKRRKEAILWKTPYT
jgi:hypothetical protein